MRSACPWPWKLHHSRLAQGGAVFGGGKGGSGGTTYQTSSVSIPPEVLARYDAVNTRAEQAASQPFQQYTGQFVAPINPVQQAAIGNIGDLTGAYGPYYAGAAASTLAGAAAGAPYFGAAGQNIDMAQAAAQPYQGLATQYGLAGTQAVNAQPLQTGRYMSPYVQSVVQPTLQALYQQQQQQQSQLMGDQARRGAFGGDRGFIQQANLAQQQGLAAAQTQGNLLNQAYGQALGAAQQQQGVNLAAQQANRAALQQFAPQALAIGQQAFQQPLTAAQAQQALGQGIIGTGTNIGQALAGYGQGLTQTGLAANQALLQAGTLGQQTQQALNTAQYNQFLQQQGYPFQVAQFLANIAEGTGALSGSTTNAATTQPGSFFSDERLKENMVEIGRTHDDQPIYRYNYKGDDPRHQQIGLSAQEVERTHPEAVGLAGGYKTVDYDAATRDAEAHRASGGLVPQSEGGAVSPEHAYAGYADGGDVIEYMTRGKRAYPYGGSRRFDVGSIRGDVPMTPPGGLQLIRAPLLDVRPQEPEFNQALNAISQAGKTAQTLGDTYSMGKEALVGGYEKNPQTGKMEPTRGVLGKAGEWSPSEGTLATGAIARTIKDATAAQQPQPGLTGTGETYAHGGRAGLAYGGDPLAEMQAMYAAAPWSQPAMGIAGATKPTGGVSGNKLMTATLPTLPSRSQSPGLLAQAGDAAAAAKNILDVYKEITKPSEGEKPPTPTDTATEKAQIEATGLGNAVEPPGYEAPTGLGVSGIEDLISAIPEARGGRIYRDAGGALPYASSSPVVPTSVLSSGEEEAKKAEQDAQRNKPPPAPGLGGGSGGGGGGASSALGDIAKVAQIAGTVASFLKQGGRVGYEEGGTPVDPNAPVPNVVPREVVEPPKAAKEQPAGKPPADDRDFGERAWDYVTAERRLIPLLTGLATMASSPSRYLGSAILQGLGGGAQQYYQMGVKGQELGLRGREVSVHEQKQGLEYINQMLGYNAQRLLDAQSRGLDDTELLKQRDQLMRAQSGLLKMPYVAPPAEAGALAGAGKPARKPWENGSAFDDVDPNSNPFFLTWASRQPGLDDATRKHLQERSVEQWKVVRSDAALPSKADPGQLVDLSPYLQVQARAEETKAGAGERGRVGQTPGEGVTPGGTKVQTYPPQMPPVIVPPIGGAQRPPAAPATPRPPISTAPLPAPPSGGAAPTPSAPPAAGAPAPAEQPPHAVYDPRMNTLTSYIPPAPVGGGFPTADTTGAIPGTLPKEPSTAQKEQATRDTEFNKEIDRVGTIDQAISRYQAMAQALKLVESGRVQAADLNKRVAEIAASFGLDDIAKRLASGEIAAAQWLSKESVNSVLDTLKSANPRFAQSEFKAVADKGTPSYGMTPQANHQMVAEMLGVLQRQKQFAQDWTKAREQGWQSVSAFYDKWNQANPLHDFVVKAQRDIGTFKGMNLPDWRNLTPGATYVVPQNVPPKLVEAFKSADLKPGDVFRFIRTPDRETIQKVSGADMFRASTWGVQ